MTLWQNSENQEVKMSLDHKQSEEVIWSGDCSKTSDSEWYVCDHQSSDMEQITNKLGESTVMIWHLDWMFGDQEDGLMMYVWKT